VQNQIADTAKARNLTEDEVIKNVILEAQPTKKLIGLNEIADLAAFLISDNAKSITGSAFSIDGGWTAK
jgi:3-hydroxybutyrate dehydrogenase